MAFAKEPVHRVTSRSTALCQTKSVNDAARRTFLNELKKGRRTSGLWGGRTKCHLLPAQLRLLWNRARRGSGRYFLSLANFRSARRICRGAGGSHRAEPQRYALGSA
jgi:hypothetical protein